MQLMMLKAKLHRASVTHAELHYDGSCAIDQALLEAADLLEFEQIQIYNLTNGERFTTYIIRAAQGSGIISMNGAAAHKARPGDQVIICAYALVDVNEAAQYKPKLIYLNSQNQIVRQH